MYRAAIEEEHEYIAAAFNGSRSVPFASKTAIANGAEQHLEVSMVLDDEVLRLERLLKEVQARSRTFQKKVCRAAAMALVFPTALS